MVEILKPPRAMVLTAPGINRDYATAAAFEMAGARAEVVHINQLKSREQELADYQIMMIPGGFSYGDHIQAGRVLSLEFRNPVMADQICEHIERGRLVLGVCNGFQVLVQSGLLPFGEIHPLYKNEATLTQNENDRFESRWIHLKARKSRCLFVSEGSTMYVPVAHGEGRFLMVDDETAEQLVQSGQIVYQYCDKDGEIRMDYSYNPNGSPMGIAAICDSSGQIMGMMPHPEDYVRREHHPSWRRMDEVYPDGLRFFENLVKVAGEL